ncbi:hypothetical protein K492DRAFT_139311 [Lichtheimia hyalospora FSU 10163]|nr:hypothetical protein K492DRAFT_139311 [Lichtheimia hyalospora FSU 10163]
MLLYIPFSVIGQINNMNPCVLQCVTQAASQGGCSSFTDISCVCTSTEFQSATLQCLTSTCTPEDQQLALSLQQQQCSTINKKY